MRQLIATLVLVALVASVGPAAGCQDYNEGLVQTNNVRATYGGGLALVWDEGLAASAKAWSRRLVKVNTCTREYNLASPNSQNVHVRWASTRKYVTQSNACSAAARTWMAQARLYQFTSEPYSDNLQNLDQVLDFVNLVWRNSTRMGCGSTVSNDRKCMVVVCEYSSKSVQTDSDFFANVKRPGPQPAEPLPEDGSVARLSEGFAFFKTADSGLCLDIPGQETESGTPLWVWTCSQTTAQWFNIKNATNDEGFYLVQERSGQRCLTVRGASTAPGAPITLETCNDLDNQKFQFNSSSASPGLYDLAAKHTLQRMCVDVQGGGVTIGSWLVLNNCSSLANVSGFTLSRVR